MENQFWNKTHSTARFPQADFTLDPSDSLMFMGSCFAEELYNYTHKYELLSTASPFGTIYNPLAMAHCLESLLSENLGEEPFYHQSRWRHNSFHSSHNFRGDEADLSGAREHFQSLLVKGKKSLLQSNYLVLTLGTAWVYGLIETGSVVNNCHKRDNRLFDRVLYAEKKEWNSPRSGGKLGWVLARLMEQNSNLQVILSVSPVRYLRDDSRENSYSKALLRCLCEELSKDNGNIHYFPAYEIVMDELRDYRWFGPDLCHLTDQAVDYVMERFLTWSASVELKEYLQKKGRQIKQRSHRPLS